MTAARSLRRASGLIAGIVLFGLVATAFGAVTAMAGKPGPVAAAPVKNVIRACCTTSYFVHVGPEETVTLARMPRELLFPAPGLPAGNVLLGYEEQGRCPMLEHDGRCSIYEQRPPTCRTYDCRVFTAAGLEADRDPLARQARRWKFAHPTGEDRDRHAAVRAAARFMREPAECFPGGESPRDPARVALLALRVYEVFLERRDGAGTTRRASSALEVAKAVMEANERFEAAPDG